MNIRTSCLVLLAALPLAATAQDTKTSSERSAKSSSVAYMDLTELIARFAKRSGKQFIVDPRVRADVPLTGFGADDVDLERLLAILNVHFFVAVDQGAWWIVVPDANARQLAGPVYYDLKFKALDGELVTVLLELKNACTAQLVPILRPMMPQAAHMAADLQSNTLVISDRAANVRRVGAMVERLERAASGQKKCEDWTPPPPPSRPQKDDKDGASR